MFVLGEHVRLKDAKSPVGIIETLNENGTALVLWGIADNQRYEGLVLFQELESLPE